MFALTGRYRRFGGFKKNGKDEARFGVFRQKLAAAVRLDFVGLCGEGCAVEFERPGVPGQPDVGRGGRRSILRASRYERKQRKGEGDEETSFHADLRNRCPSAHSTREVAIPVEPRNIAYRIAKHQKEARALAFTGTEFRGRRESRRRMWAAPPGSSRNWIECRSLASCRRILRTPLLPMNLRDPGPARVGYLSPVFLQQASDH